MRWSKEQLVDRMLADAMEFDSWNIRTGNLVTNYRKAIDAAVITNSILALIDDTRV